MANLVKTPGVVLGTAKVAILTCAIGTQVAVSDVVLSNPSASVASASLYFYSAASGTEVPLLATYPLAAGGAPYRFPSKVLGLQPGDEIRAFASAANAITAALSVAITAAAAPVARGFTLRGAYATAATYGTNDIVTFGGLAYASRVDGNQGNHPDAVPAAWQVILAPTFVYASVADVWAGTDAGKVVTAKLLADAQKFQTMNTGVPDFAAGLNFKRTRTGAELLGEPVNMKEGQAGTIRLDGPGSLTFSNAWDFGLGGAPTPSAAAGTFDYLDYQVVNPAGGAKSVRAFYNKAA